MNRIIALSLTLLFAIAIAPLSAQALNQTESTHLIQAGIHPKTLKTALTAYDWAVKHDNVHKKVMTLIDYSESSLKKRMWVIDMTNGNILFNGLVTQAAKSGFLYATHFSNSIGSKMTSLGAFTTGHTYDGKHGYSLRIRGLERGLNNNVGARAVVFHPASYATPRFARTFEYLGHSWGCFAINPAHSHYVLETIKNGSFVFAYAPREMKDPNFSSQVS